MGIDETWAKTNMAPLRGWAPVGQRLQGSVPYGHWKTMTIPAALREQAGLLPGAEVEFSITGKTVRITQLRGKGDAALSTDAIMAFTRDG